MQQQAINNATTGNLGVLQVIKHVLWSPVTGTQLVLANTVSVRIAAALMGVAFIFVTSFALAIISQMYVLSAKTIMFGVKIGLSFFLFLLMLSLVVFLVKKIFAVTTFKSDLMVGGLAGLALMVQTVLLLIVLLLFRDSLITMFVDGPVTFSPQVALLFFVIAYGGLYMLLLVQQSLSIAGVSPSRSWYLSPLVVAAAVFIARNVGEWMIAQEWVA